MVCEAHLKLLQRSKEAALESRQLRQAQRFQARAAAGQRVKTGSSQLSVAQNLQLLAAGAVDWSTDGEQPLSQPAETHHL